MSEDALADYVEARSKLGDDAPQPVDEEAKTLVGTVKLAEAALGTPMPSEEAERQSRERLMSQLQETVARAPIDEDEKPGIIDRIKRIFKGDD